MSKLKTNTIQHTGGSADNITLDNSQNVTVENNLTVDGTSTLTGKVTGGGDIECSSGYYQTSSGTNRFSLTHDGANCYLENQIGSFYVKSSDNANPLEVNNNAVTLNNANLVIGTSGKGIDFSATADGTSGAAELFNDYEDGEFTPSYSTPDTNGGFSQYHQYGYYTKIGNVVTVTVYLQGHCNNNAGGDTDDNVVITGLPFAPLQLPSGGNNRHQANWAIGSTYKMEVDDLEAYTYGGNTYIALMVPSNGGTGTTLKSNQMDQNTTQFNATATYRI